MDDKTFAAKLKAARISAGKSVADISAYLTSLGVKASEKTVYSWEAGRSQPTPDTLLDMCEFYGVKDIMVAFGYKKEDPANQLVDEAALDEEIISRLCRLTPEEMEKVDAFVQGLLAAR